MPELTPKDIRNLVGDKPTMLEIGCNDGTDTLKFLQAMPDAQIYCFEPDPRAIARFKETVKDKRVMLTEAAVSDADGTTTFYGSAGKSPKIQPGATHYCMLDEWDLSGSIHRPTGHLKMSPWVTFPENRRYQVKSLRLDTWLAEWEPFEIPCIDFIWADVQGGEHTLIRGATKALSITKYFYTEYYDTPMYEGQVPLEVIKTMLPGFDFVRTYNNNALFRNRSVT